MNTGKKTILFIVTILCFHSVEAQIFATRQLEYLSSLMKCNIPHQSEKFHCSQAGNLPLTVEYDESGAVCHLGVAIFSDDTKNGLGVQVCNFQERLFLEIFLQGDETKARKLLDEYRVVCPEPLGSFYGFWENALKFAATANEYSLTKDSLTWTGSWNGSMQTFTLRFPSNFDLILGMDKKEAEIRLGAQLKAYRCKHSLSAPPTVDSRELTQLDKTVYVKRGKNLFMREMNGNLYFYKDVNAFRLLYDRKFPKESIANLFNRPTEHSDGLNIKIRQTAYGGESLSYTVKLADLQCFMYGDYETFTGIEKCTADTVEFSVIYQSRFYNCWHLLYVQTSFRTLFDRQGDLHATFYTFIPNQNVSNLYKEYIDNEKIQVKRK